MGNSILQLRGAFGQKANNSRPGAAELPAHRVIESSEVRRIQDTLASVRDYWTATPHEHKPIVAVRYKRVIPKSGRIRRLLCETGMRSSNETIAGARFHDNGTSKQHVITHCVSMEALESAIADLENLAYCIDALCGGKLSTERLREINEEKTDFEELPLKRSVFARLAVDVCHIERFMINDPMESIDQNSLVTLYKNTGIDNIEFLRSIGVAELNLHSYDGTTFLLTPDQYRLLYKKAPQLIAMSVHDLNVIPSDPSSEEKEAVGPIIPGPGNEPIVGVFDSPFDQNVYFSDWVDYTSNLDENLLEEGDYFHGTAVSSIIVDGPSLNPMLDDGCGRFRVRHVGVASGRTFSSFTIIREIEEAVIRNPEIKVWNLSLGSYLEVHDNFASAEAATLDRIQNEHDVVFVIAGTNDRDETMVKRIGAPADSINSLVVSSVRQDGTPASYSRKGPVLSFFGKPDVAYYGGDDDLRMCVCGKARSSSFVRGTSFAAPWIARKMAYLIQIAGLSREAAKALIIDSACGWEPSNNPNMVGYGVVPRRIEDILTTPNDEIKFILTGVSEKYDTYSHNIPVPIFQEKHPYFAKATLCYFPHCERSQGVDYTSTEMSISFGRLNGERIDPIDNNLQDLSGSFTYEEDARQYFRKWDNVKHISEKISSRSRARKVYGAGLWGISLKTKERLDEPYGGNIRFGVVITLKSMDGVNRIEDFIQRCSFRAWIVSKIDVESQIEIFNAAEQEIEFD